MAVSRAQLGCTSRRSQVEVLTAVSGQTSLMLGPGISDRLVWAHGLIAPYQFRCVKPLADVVSYVPGVVCFMAHMCTVEVVASSAVDSDWEAP